MKINHEERRSLTSNFFSIATIVAVVFLSCNTALTQDDAQPLTPEQEKAQEILGKAAAKQGGEEIVADLRNFKAFFNLIAYDKERGQGNFKVERIFDDSGTSGRMWTRKKHDDKNAKHSILVHDGEEAWRIGHDGQVAIFTDKPDAFKTDLENLEDDLRLTRQMFRFFFVRTLIDELDELALVGESRVRDRDVYRIEGKTTAWLGDEDETAVYLVIHVDKKEYTINEVELIDLSIKDRRRTFVFGRYNKNEQGVLVPGNVKIYGKTTEHWDFVLSLKVEEKETNTGTKVFQQILFNIKVDEKLFEIPS